MERVIYYEKLICPKCKKRIKVVKSKNSFIDKWICKKHGNINKALYSPR